ncbi:hypothetical protein JXQ31_05395 [candidate division KSB1 bacterium]|nr:hypothetical protein [candidate division KSB1 bacterium]
MKKLSKIIVFMIILLSSISPAWASGTRLQSLGYLTNFYLIDSYNIWLYPSTIVDYNNKIFLESYTGNPLAEGGINLPINPNTTIGVYLSDQNRVIKYVDPEPGMNMANQQIDLFAGYRAQQFDVGLHLARYNNKMEYSNPKDAKQDQGGSLGSLTIEGGASFKPDESSRVDAAISYTNRSFSYELGSRDTVKVREPYGHHSISFSARYMRSLSEKVVLVPFFNYTYNGAGYEFLVEQVLITQNIHTFLEKQNILNLGVAFNIIPREFVLVTCAAGMVRQSSTTETSLITGTAPVAAENSYSALPFVNIGVEADLLKWLGFRLSMYKLIQKMTQNSPVDNTTLDQYDEYFNQYSANLGIYFRLGRLKIDALLDTNNAANFLHNGPFILSGKDYSGTNLFTQVSLIYGF